MSAQLSEKAQKRLNSALASNSTSTACQDLVDSFYVAYQEYEIMLATKYTLFQSTTSDFIPQQVLTPLRTRKSRCILREIKA